MQSELTLLTMVSDSLPQRKAVLRPAPLTGRKHVQHQQNTATARERRATTELGGLGGGGFSTMTGCKGRDSEKENGLKTQHAQQVKGRLLNRCRSVNHFKK